MIHTVEEIPNKNSRIFYVTKDGDGVTTSTNDIISVWKKFIVMNNVYYWVYVSDIIDTLSKTY